MTALATARRRLENAQAAIETAKEAVDEALDAVRLAAAAPDPVEAAFRNAKPRAEPATPEELAADAQVTDDPGWDEEPDE